MDEQTVMKLGDRLLMVVLCLLLNLLLWLGFIYCAVRVIKLAWSGQ